MIFPRKDEEYLLRQKIMDEANVFEDNLRRNHGRRLSKEEISARRVRYEGERYLYMTSIKKKTENQSSVYETL